MSKEYIKLVDFVTEAGEILGCDMSLIEPETRTKYFCPQCGRTYNKDTKFCSDDATKIAEDTYNVNSETYNGFISHMIWDLSEGCPDEFSYESVDHFDKRGDGDGYYSCFIFKRKSDGQHFYYTSYDGRWDEEDTLSTCEPIIKTSWDFESSFD